MKRTILSWTLVILWMVLIFIFSHQPAAESNELSTGITKKLYDLIMMLAPNNKLDQESLNYIIRKSAHFVIYLFLGLLTANGLIHSNITGFRSVFLALLICILYAISDEIHQLYVPGRSGQVSDVFIDSLGGLSGIIIMSIIRKAGTKDT